VWNGIKSIIGQSQQERHSRLDDGAKPSKWRLGILNSVPVVIRRVSWFRKNYTGVLMIKGTVMQLRPHTHASSIPAAIAFSGLGLGRLA
jgi:hypothetical protein